MGVGAFLAIGVWPGTGELHGIGRLAQRPSSWIGKTHKLPVS